MNKDAQSPYPLADFIKKRWSPRAFADRPIEAEHLLTLLEAARWGPSSRNEQPWRFIVAAKTDPQAYENALACINERNQQWAKTAPVLLFSVAKLNIDRNDSPNRYAFHDVGLAIGGLLAQATALGIYAHQMGGFNADKTRQVYQIPETYAPVAAMALGYLSLPEDLSEEIQTRDKAPRTRQTLSELVFAESWGQTASFIPK